MTVKDIELRSGMTRANIRYYESLGLLSPAREENGYRDYGEADLDILLKIKLLRSLEVSLEDIGALSRGERELSDVLARQMDVLEAKENARIALAAGELDDVQFEIIDSGSKGIFGIIGVRPAKVRAFIELPDVHEKRNRSDRPKKENKGGEAKKTEKKEDRKPKTKKPEKKAEKKPAEKKAVSAKPLTNAAKLKAATEF